MSAIITVRLSDVASAFMAATLDLLEAVTDADEVLVTDEIREAADRLLSVVEAGRGEL